MLKLLLIYPPKSSQTIKTRPLFYSQLPASQTQAIGGIHHRHPIVINILKHPVDARMNQLIICQTISRQLIFGANQEILPPFLRPWMAINIESNPWTSTSSDFPLRPLPNKFIAPFVLFAVRDSPYRRIGYTRIQESFSIISGRNFIDHRIRLISLELDTWKS